MVSQNSSPIGSYISIQRNKAGLSQEALATRLHVTRQTISNWEGGKSLPDIESLKSLAEALEIPIEYLIYGELGTARREQHVLRLKSWCRWLGIAVLAIGFLYGIRSGIFINRQEHLDWRLSDMVSVWIPSLLWGTILLGISRILTLLQDKGP